MFKIVIKIDLYPKDFLKMSGSIRDINIKNIEDMEQSNQQLEGLKEKKQEYHRSYYQNNKDKLKQYYQRNKDKIKDTASKWRQNNKEKVKENAIRWRQNNRDKYNQYQRNYYQQRKLKKQSIIKIQRFCRMCICLKKYHKIKQFLGYL